MTQKKTPFGALSQATIQHLLLDKSQETKILTDRIKAHLLSYLRDLPGKIHRNGPDAMGEVAIQTGNLLLWLTGTLAPHEPPVEYGLDETAETLHGLGKQFRAVGVPLFNEKSIRKSHTLQNLKMDLELLQARFARFEAEPEQREAA